MRTFYTWSILTLCLSYTFQIFPFLMIYLQNINSSFWRQEQNLYLTILLCTHRTISYLRMQGRPASSNQKTHILAIVFIQITENYISWSGLIAELFWGNMRNALCNTYSKSHDVITTCLTYTGEHLVQSMIHVSTPFSLRFLRKLEISVSMCYVCGPSLFCCPNALHWHFIRI